MNRFENLTKAVVCARGARDKGMVTAEHAVGTVFVVAASWTLWEIIRRYMENRNLFEFFYRFCQWLWEWLAQALSTIWF